MQSSSRLVEQGSGTIDTDLTLDNFANDIDSKLGFRIHIEHP
ncbi:hypothetical protein VCRA2121O157_250036 [Vibrio crassostreae]|nr:hypothetical protein VCRA2113O137_210064 [Vibrio crassostreae]CAK1938412.1 hypothetical protein VCRA2113O138_250057 [Vibrio crassostreae]CAK1941418.1 hypothetical protein VCRA2113O140_250036 [Vibrio crassostreae]CAK2281694.1 hypothetical protein VCRA2116O141_180058 [Vibrio crassostreae]CAK2517114.1 hypothetical protein VCRA2113O415_590002 [Vibrio crassostreae]